MDPPPGCSSPEPATTFDASVSERFRPICEDFLPNGRKRKRGLVGPS
jgi:hypothetical protein